MTEHHIIRQTTRRATPEEANAVQHIEILTGVAGVVTGIPTVQDDGSLHVLMYSAGCVHDVYVIPADWRLRLIPDPRRV